MYIILLDLRQDEIGDLANKAHKRRSRREYINECPTELDQLLSDSHVHVLTLNSTGLVLLKGNLK